MTKFNTRIVTAVATAAVIMGAVAPAAFAATNVTVVGNGAFTNNSVQVNNTTGTKVIQKNSSNIITTVNSTASTGGNHADFNTGGGTGVTSGDATSNVNVTVGGSNNTATVTPPVANTTTKVIVAGNGAFSKTNVGVSNSSWFTVIQSNWSNIINTITSTTDTGHNTSSFNTGGGTGVTSGDATSNVTVNVTGSNNTLNQ